MSKQLHAYFGPNSLRFSRSPLSGSLGSLSYRYKLFHLNLYLSVLKSLWGPLLINATELVNTFLFRKSAQLNLTKR